MFVFSTEGGSGGDGVMGHHLKWSRVLFITLQCTGQLPPQTMVQPKVKKTYYRFMDMWFKKLEHRVPSFHRCTKEFVSKINSLFDSSWTVGLNEVHWRSTRCLKLVLLPPHGSQVPSLERVCRHILDVSV